MYIRTKNMIHQVEGETFDKQGYYIDEYEYYLNYFGCYHNGFDVELLTKDEFDLLKEVLE